MQSYLWGDSRGSRLTANSDSNTMSVVIPGLEREGGRKWLGNTERRDVQKEFIGNTALLRLGRNSGSRKLPSVLWGQHTRPQDG